MTNREQLFIQLIGLTLAVITLILSITKPVYDKLEDMGRRLAVIETKVKYYEPQGAK
jgi:hypothetical protein